jgi:hypothetical protein
VTNALTPIEREVIGLCICCDALSDLVNHAMLLFTKEESRPDEMEVRFHTEPHQSLFLIRLLDFLSEKGSAALLGEKASCLDVLKQAASHRHLSPGDAGDDLAIAVEALHDWLETSITIKPWIPVINQTPALSVTRHQLLRISGNQAKHNPSRLSVISQEVQKLLDQAGNHIEIEVIPFVLDDLREHLAGNFFIYCATWIAELLNDVRWGLQRYLISVYNRSCPQNPSIESPFNCAPPAEIMVDSPTELWFRALMMHVWRQPIIPRFRASKSLRGQSSLEW